MLGVRSGDTIVVFFSHRRYCLLLSALPLPRSQSTEPDRHRDVGPSQCQPVGPEEQASTMSRSSARRLGQIARIDRQSSSHAHQRINGRHERNERVSVATLTGDGREPLRPRTSPSYDGGSIAVATVSYDPDKALLLQEMGFRSPNLVHRALLLSRFVQWNVAPIRTMPGMVDPLVSLGTISLPRSAGCRIRRGNTHRTTIIATKLSHLGQYISRCRSNIQILGNTSPLVDV